MVHFRKYTNTLLLSLIFIFFTACTNPLSKQICAYCGEEKFCEEYKILDSSRYICKDCLEKAAGVSINNVIPEYETPPLDPLLFGVGSEQYKKAMAEENAENEENEGSEDIEENPDISSQDEIYTDIDTDTNNDTDSQPSVTPSEQNNTSNDSEIISKINSVLSSSGLTVSPKGSDYQIIDDAGNYADIDVLFENVDHNTMSIMNHSQDNAINFQTVVMAAIAACLGESDPNGLSTEVFMYTKQYANYNQDGCKFYYSDDIYDGDNGTTYEEFDLTY